MQLKHLKAFNAVARLQSFSEAVAVTGLSQPTLSRLIKQLENDINVELIDRYHRPLQLTEAGDFFYHRTNAVLQDLDNVISLTQKLSNPPETLTIGFVPSILYGMLPKILSAIKQQLPNLEVNVKDISSFKQLDALKAGDIDIGFGRFPHKDSLIHQILLRHERYVVALPKTHPLAQLDDIRLGQLQDEKVILYHQTHLPISQNNSASTPSEPLLYLFDKQAAIPHQTTAVSDIQVALGLVAAGEGVTLVPDSLKKVRPEQISYCRVFHEDTTTPIYISTLYQPRHTAFDTILDIIYDIYEEQGITYRKHT